MRAWLVVVALALAACGEAYPGLPEGIAWGTVIRVQEAPPSPDVEELDWAYDHPLVPDMAWQVIVRVDGGAVLTLAHNGDRRYEPGERVRVLFDEELVLLL